MLNNIETIFKHLHMYPELSYEEFETTKYIYEYLSKYPLEIHKLNPTGLIAVLNKNYEDTLVFRSDIDALPVVEKNDLEYKSCNPNTSHACGHDGHMTMLLQFITNIFENNLKFEKNLIFIFQPAEEKDGGATLVLESKVLDDFNIVGMFGMHMWPELPTGTLGLKSDSLMGTNYSFDLNIYGKSAHASTPQFSVDTTQVLAEVITNINFLIAKTKSPFEPCVISIGKINGGVAGNVIIDEINVVGTIRATNDEDMAKTISDFERMLKALEVKFDCKIELIQTEMTYPAVINNEEIINEVVKHLKNDKDFEFEMLKIPTLAAEDFGFYCQKFKSAFFFLGTDEEKHNYKLHSPYFSFDIKVLETGVKFYEKLLKIYG